MRSPQLKRRLLQSFKAAAILLFMVLSCGLWLSLDSAWGMSLYFIALLVPNYICGEWLGDRIFSDSLGRRVSEKGFSAARVVVSVLLILAVYGLLFGLAILGQSLLVS